MPIIVCPMSRAPEIARERKPWRVVSLLDPGSNFITIDGYEEAERLRVSVHDVEEALDGHDYPADLHLNSILDFVSAWDRNDPLLVHCYLGISRSTATAFITACLHNPDIDENRIAMTLREASPTASPNRRFVALADDALCRKGRMVDAINAIGRGPPWQEVGEAKPFVLPSRYELTR
jgi:predicted protein tyrosine phosphatase